MWRWNGLRINKKNREDPLSHTSLSIHNLMFWKKKLTNFCISNSKCHAIFTHNICWYFLWWRHSLFFSKKTHWRQSQAWGNAKRLVISPPTRIKDPIEAAIPMHIVYTSGSTSCIASKIAIPGNTHPPGQFINKYKSWVWSSILRYTIRPTR